MEALMSWDVELLVIQFRNWVEFVIRVAGIQPQSDVAFLGLHVTTVVLAGWGAMHFLRNRAS